MKSLFTVFFTFGLLSALAQNYPDCTHLKVESIDLDNTGYLNLEISNSCTNCLSAMNGCVYVELLIVSTISPFDTLADYGNGNITSDNEGITTYSILTTLTSLPSLSEIRVSMDCGWDDICSNIPFSSTLVPRVKILEEVVIKSSRIEAVIKSERSSILDYSFYGDNILLIIFANKLSKSKLVLITPNLDTLSNIDIPARPSKLSKDCLGNNHIICDKNVYQVYFDSTKLQLLPPLSIETFEAILVPCIAQDSANLYFMEKIGSHQVDMGRLRIQTNNHVLRYYYINRTNKQNFNLVTIADQEILKKSSEEEGYLNAKESAGMYRKPVMKEFDRIFAETILYKEVYAPLFIIYDTIYIFDYINSKIQNYSLGRISKEVEIKYHTDKNWKSEMCVDGKKQKAYAIFESTGITELKEINLNTGLLMNSYIIPFPFNEGIKAHDNYIYFLHQAKGNANIKYLSRLRIY